MRFANQKSAIENCEFVSGLLQTYVGMAVSKWLLRSH